MRIRMVEILSLGHTLHQDEGEKGQGHTSKADSVDLPHPLAPHNRTVTDSFLSRIL